MILDRAATLENASNLLRQREDLANQRAAWVSHTDRFNDLTQRLRPPLEFLQWLHRRCDQKQCAGDLGALGVSAKAMKSLVQTLVSKPETVLRGNQISDAARNVEQAIKQLETQAATSWATHLGHEGWVPATLWAALQAHPEHGANVRSALEQDQLYDQLRRLPFPDAERQLRYAALLEKRAKLREDLPDISDEDVNAFVVASGASGALISALTPGVMEWLAANDLMNSYVIRQRAT